MAEIANFSSTVATSLIDGSEAFTTLPIITPGDDLQIPPTTDLTFLEKDEFTLADGTELPLFNSTDFTNSTDGNITYYYDDYNGTDYYYYDYDYEDTKVEEEEPYNPFLAFDYDYYDANNLTRNLNYSSSELSDDNWEETWKNVNNPPSKLPIRAFVLDLNPYYLWGPPSVALLVVFLIFLPCVIMMWRDDCREKKGKPRIYGYSAEVSNRGNARPPSVKERYNPVDPEWVSPRVREASPSPGASGQRQDINLVVPDQPSPNGSRHSGHSRADQYAEDNEVAASGNRSKRSTSRQEPPVDYTAEATGGASGSPSSSPSGTGGAGATAFDDQKRKETLPSSNFSAVNKSQQPKFTGWNKDLYSDSQAAGGGEPGNKEAAGTTSDPSWGMY